MDMFEKCRSYANSLSGQRRAGAALFYRAVDPIDGRYAVRNGRRLLMLGSNDYLGLTHDPRVKQAAAEAALRHGSSSCGARINNGTTSLHQRLEHELAELKGVERVMVFSNGFMAMLGTIATLAGAGDVVFCDQENHASLIDGCRASGAEVRVFRHNDMRHLARLLGEYERDKGKLIVVDGVFSQTGRIIDLPAIVTLAQAHGARVMLDDAHATGVLGAHGHGTAEHYGLRGQVDIVGGTFSKALGAVGGFVGSTREVIDYMHFHCRAHMFTAAPPTSVVASVLKTLEILAAEPERRERMVANARYLQQGLRAAGFTVLDSSTPITPLITGSYEGALRMTARLEQEGIFVNPIGPPAVPPNQARLRLTPTAAHTPEDLQFVIDTLARVAEEVGVLAPCA
jgi:8-amino-7-oxononanoate synthase